MFKLQAVHQNDQETQKGRPHSRKEVLPLDFGFSLCATVKIGLNVPATKFRGVEPMRLYKIFKHSVHKSSQPSKQRCSNIVKVKL